MRKVIPIQVQLTPEALIKIKEEFGDGFQNMIKEMFESYLLDSSLLFNVDLDVMDNSLTIKPISFRDFVLIRDKGLILSNGFVNDV